MLIDNADGYFSDEDENSGLVDEVADVKNNINPFGLTDEAVVIVDDL